jgi:hypothetical protein
MEALKHFRTRHHEVLVFHIVDRQEELFEFKRETNLSIVRRGKNYCNSLANPQRILDNYQSFVDTLKNECHTHQIEYNPVNTSTPLEDLLLKYLIKRSRG